PWLFRLLDDLDHPPALPFRQGPRFHDAHRVAQLGAVLVMRGDRLGAVDLLAVEPVREPALHRDRDGLLHLVAHDGPRPNFPTAALGHAFTLSFRIVWIRAMSRRIVRNWSGLVRDSVARRNSSRNFSSVSTASFCVNSSVLSSRSPSGLFSRFAGILPLLALHELRLDRQLRRRERQRRARRRLFDTFELEHDPPRFHHRDPALRIALALPHPG